MTTVARRDVLVMLDDLPNDLLPEVLRFLQGLKPRGSSPRGAASAAASARAAQEASLLEVARRHLPAATQRRLDDLRILQEEGRLSPAERAELLDLVDRVEQQDAERAEAIVALARLRGVAVGEVLRELSPERVGDGD